MPRRDLAGQIFRDPKTEILSQFGRVSSSGKLLGAAESNGIPVHLFVVI
jgi:hypothetical protein